MNPSVLEYHRLTESLLRQYEESNNDTPERKNIETQLKNVENSYSFLFNEYNFQRTCRQLFELRHNVKPPKTVRDLLSKDDSQIPPTQLNTVNNKRKLSKETYTKKTTNAKTQ
jgi:hypothetical protein